uniref:Uncharacterized protein n=1 Tax=Anguilla anguilla TaxID=7936 RepID=A0A0E9XKU4_ANGAN
MNTFTMYQSPGKNQASQNLGPPYAKFGADSDEGIESHRLTWVAVGGQSGERRRRSAAASRLKGQITEGLPGK